MHLQKYSAAPSHQVRIGSMTKVVLKERLVGVRMVGCVSHQKVLVTRLRWVQNSHSFMHNHDSVDQCGCNFLSEVGSEKLRYLVLKRKEFFGNKGPGLIAGSLESSLVFLLWLLAVLATLRSKEIFIGSLGKLDVAFDTKNLHVVAKFTLSQLSQVLEVGDSNLTSNISVRFEIRVVSAYV